MIRATTTTPSKADEISDSVSAAATDDDNNNSNKQHGERAAASLFIRIVLMSISILDNLDVMCQQYKYYAFLLETTNRHNYYLYYVCVLQI